jgi:Cation transporter/ATPase, N-terminus
MADLAATVHGLTDEESAARLVEEGPNELAQGRRRGRPRRRASAGVLSLAWSEVLKLFELRWLRGA